MRPEWQLKRDPERHPVRFLAGLWEQHTGTHLTPKELGQLRDLRRELGECTHGVVQWMLDSGHWWRFCQHVRTESGSQHSAPPHPHVGFLVKHRNRALKLVRVALNDSTAPADVRLCEQFDVTASEGWRSLLLVLAAGRPKWQARIDAAQTLIDLQRVFIDIDMVDEDGAASA